MIKFSQDGVERAVLRTAQEILSAAREKCPVRTGRLKNSIALSAQGSRAEVFTDVEYAAAVELGTSGQRPQPYLSYGASQGAKKAGSIFREELL